MRINKYVASATGLSRRAADRAILAGRVQINSIRAELGSIVSDADSVTLDGTQINLPSEATTILLHKPVGYVSSRKGQGSRTIYDLLPAQYEQLKPVGRLDKDSSGLMLLTDDGILANSMMHPKYRKIKLYEVTLNTELQPLHQQMIVDHGVQLDDGPSKFHLEKLDKSGIEWLVTMSEGRNRQIRRTFSALGYGVTKLHRTKFGEYTLSGLQSGQYKPIKIEKLQDN